MRILPVLVIPLLSSCLSSTAPNNTAMPDQLELKAKNLAQEFTSQLKPQLKQALQQGGAIKAIEVCAEKAPAIAKNISDESGWVVKRVSLKARNSSLATPDEWEFAMLTEFDRRQRAGEQASSLQASTINGSYRYIQAQGVGGVCLQCHGQTINADVREALQQYYPDDRAIGYSMGQIRGGVSVSKSLP